MSPEDLSIVSMVRNAGPMVQFVIYILLGFSIATWTIILMKYLYVRRAFKESAQFIEYFWKTRDFSNAFARAKDLKNSPVARIFRNAYIELRKLNRPGAQEQDDTDFTANVESIRRVLGRSRNVESVRMIQMVPFLATTGNIAPFIGLFGTVWGIMNAFRSIAIQAGSTSLGTVAPGVSEALVATAAGLAVAIPAVMAFNYFTQKIRIIESEMESFSSDFMSIVENEARRQQSRES
ncbi:MAG: protein TolQ [Desulfosalsimonadaceae bacterium]